MGATCAGLRSAVHSEEGKGPKEGLIWNLQLPGGRLEPLKLCAPCQRLLLGTHPVELQLRGRGAGREVETFFLDFSRNLPV